MTMMMMMTMILTIVRCSNKLMFDHKVTRRVWELGLTHFKYLLGASPSAINELTNVIPSCSDSSAILKLNKHVTHLSHILCNLVTC